MGHANHQLDEADKQPIGAQLWPTFRLLGIGAAIGLLLFVVGVLFEFAKDGGDWQGRFFYAYLIGYCFILGLTVGSVALVILTHLFRAGWVVAVRRVPETFAANFWIVAILSIPILVGAMIPSAPLYPWSASLEVADKNLKAAQAFIHDRDHGDGHHDDKKTDETGTATANAEDEPEFYVASSVLADQASSQDSGSAEGDPADTEAEQPGYGPPVERSQGYEAAAMAMAATVYDGETREENREIQKAYYTLMLSYMMDYKRYGGKLDMARDAETGEVIRDEKGKAVKDGKVEEGYGFTWLSPIFFAIRMVLYFAIFSLMGWYFWNKSVQQDETGDPELTTKREWWAPLSVLSFALCVTFMSFDILMSLDPAWYSTMFGVIFFANSFTAAIAGTILICMFLQKKGYLKTVNTEHYHDLGKLLFAFVFFWGYVSFSQFMLIWYASFPETAYWFEIHGMTTVKTAPQYGSGWTYISLLMLFGHLLVPFAFLLSRHVKRNLTALAGASVWMLLMVYVDIFWYAMPFFRSPGVTFGLAEIGAVMLLISLVLMAFIHRFRKHAPLAYGDPRLTESTALDTNVWAPLHH